MYETISGIGVRCRCYAFIIIRDINNSNSCDPGGVSDGLARGWRYTKLSLVYRLPFLYSILIFWHALCYYCKGIV